MICAYCGTFFCWDNADMSIFNGDRKRFCTETCGKAYNRKHRAKYPEHAQPISACVVCSRKFRPPDDDRRFCSEVCREFARQHAVPVTRLARLWKLERGCPSGKVKHQSRAEAMKAARRYVSVRYAAFPSWLSAYKCDRCFCWHLTSKPQVHPNWHLTKETTTNRAR